MLVSLKTLMNDANAKNYAVIAANCFNYDSARALIEAAEAERSPLILNIAEGHLKSWIRRDTMALEISPLCEEASVPVCINLDHGFTWSVIVSSVTNGFTSVMTDNSSYPLEENIARTKKVVDLAHARGISVEAEIGHVGQGTNAVQDTVTNLTDVKEAKIFAEATGVDALAVAVGTAHGEYPQGFVPKLDFDRLQELKDALKMPLVLHGGSGSGDENLAKAAAMGINKINIFTDTQVRAREKIYAAMETNKKLFPLDIMQIMYEGVTEKCRYYMQLFGSTGKADEGEFEQFHYKKGLAGVDELEGSDK